MNPNASQLWRAPMWALALLLALLSMLAPFAVDTYLPAFTGIAQSLDASAVQMQQTLSSYLFGYAFMNLFHGALSDSVGRRPVILAGTALFALASAGCALSESIGALVTFRALQGMSTGAGVVVSRAIIRDMFPPAQAQKVMSQVTIYFGIAPAVAPIIGGWASDFFAARKLTLAVRWTSPEGAAELGVMFTHWEFFFLVSAVIGLYALHRLSLVQESGFTGRREVVSHIVYSARRNLGNISSVTGLREAMSFPAGELIKLRERKMAIIQGLQERLRSSLSLSTRRQVTGWVLEAGYAVPPPDPSLDDLLDRIA